jgi:RHS repeat-associated protein
VLSEDDLRVDGLGAVWGHSRAYTNQLQGDAKDKDFGNGFNWIVSQWAQLVQEPNGTIVVLRNLGNTIWFDKQGNTYVSRYGARYELEQDTANKQFRFFTPGGFVWKFHDFTVGESATTSPGKLKDVSPPGNDAAKFIRVIAFNSGNYAAVERGTGVIERFDYAYVNKRLVTVTLTRGGTPVERIQYTYHAGGPRGSAGDLRTVVKEKWTGSAWQATEKTYYRYYVAQEPDGFVHALKYVVGPDAFIRLNTSDPDSKTDPEIAAVADYFFRYDSDRRVVEERAAAGTRIYGFSFIKNSDPSYIPGPNTWQEKSTEVRPDGSTLVVYTNHIGQVIVRDLVDTTGRRWIDYQVFGAFNYAVMLHVTASCMRGYQANPNGTITITASEPNGLCRLFTYDAAHGDNLESEKVMKGITGGSQPITVRSYTYISHLDGISGKVMHVLASETENRSENPSAPNPATTSYAYEWHTNGGVEVNQIKQRTMIFPIVPVSENGTGLVQRRRQLFDIFGNEVFEQGPCGYVRKQIYDIELGVVSESTDDYNGPDIPASWLPLPPNAGLNLTTNYQHDDLGRLTEELGPDHLIVTGQGQSIVARSATWHVYRDFLSDPTPSPNVTQERMTGRGYVSASGAVLINPVSMLRLDAEGRIIDSVEASRGLSVESPGALTSVDAFPFNTWVRRTLSSYDTAGRLTATRVYTQFNPGDLYAETRYGYDALGRQDLMTSPEGTITRTSFEARGLPITIEVGTSLSPSNLVIVTENEYDGGLGGGNGNITKVTQRVDATNARVMSYGYDWRDRRVTTSGPLNLYMETSYDNIDRPILAIERVASPAGKLLSQVESRFDTRGRLYRQITFGVSPSTGVLGIGLEDNSWFDGCGTVVQQIAAGASKTFVKHEYDGVGRRIATYVGYPSGTPDPYSIANDFIFEETRYAFDSGGDLRLLTTKRRYHDATGTGAFRGPLGIQPKSRDSFVAKWYDGRGREVVSANYGTNEGGTILPPLSVPAPSTNILVSQFGYNHKGDREYVTDPAGRVVRSTFDSAGRQTLLLQNYVPGGTSPDQNIITSFTYNFDNKLTQLTAFNLQTGAQTTTYAFGVTQPDSGLYTKDLLAQVTYPDAGIVQYRYNRQGDVTSMTDQNGTTHAYLYDARGRRTTDQIASVSDPAINLSVRKIVTTFNEKGLVSQVRSFASLVASNPVHSVLFTYNDFNRLSREEQRHSSLIPPVGSETAVSHSYANGQNNTIRLQSMTYPNGRLIQYSYPGDGDALNRVQAILDSNGQQLVAYTYLGLAEFVETMYVPPSVKSSLILGTGSTPYSALDTFDRLLTLRWQKTGATPTDLVKLGYTYDAASNRMTVDNQVAPSGWDYAFTYDGLQRLATANRGDLTVGGTITNSQLLESWSLDQTGNWGGYQRTVPVGTGLNQTRTHNTVNEITGITNQAPPAWMVPSFDNNGNMRVTPKPADPSQSFTLAWDGWNRLVRVDDGANPVVTHAYDGLGRRIMSTPTGQSVRHLFYSSSWQALEERVGAATTPDRQYVWGLRYIDDYVFQEVSQAAGSPVRHWGLQDGNWNVVGLADDTGVVAQRYAYDSYGTVDYLTPGFSGQPTPTVSNDTTFTGRLLISSSGTYDFRRRQYLAQLGQFANRDPIGYQSGDLNLYRYVRNRITGFTDPTGTEIDHIHIVFNEAARPNLRYDLTTVEQHINTIIANAGLILKVEITTTTETARQAFDAGKLGISHANRHCGCGYIQHFHFSNKIAGHLASTGRFGQYGYLGGKPDDAHSELVSRMIDQRFQFRGDDPTKGRPDPNILMANIIIHELLWQGLAKKSDGAQTEKHNLKSPISDTVQLLTILPDEVDIIKARLQVCKARR